MKMAAPGEKRAGANVFEVSSSPSMRWARSQPARLLAGERGGWKPALCAQLGMRSMQPSQLLTPPSHGIELGRRGLGECEEGMDPDAGTEGAGATLLDVESRDFDG